MRILKINNIFLILLNDRMDNKLFTIFILIIAHNIFMEHPFYI
jgi:hypothetical protein